MKKVLLVMMTMMMAIAANAKDDKVTLTSGDGTYLASEGKTASLVVDYSKTIVEGKAPLNEYLKSRGDEFVRDWPKVAEAAKKQFTTVFNKKNKKGLQISENGSDYQFNLVVNKLDLGSTGVSVVFGGLGSAGGAEVSGTLIVTDKDGKKVAEYDVHEVRGNGSTDYTEGRRLGTCFENVVKMMLKASK